MRESDVSINDDASKIGQMESGQVALKDCFNIKEDKGSVNPITVAQTSINVRKPSSPGIQKSNKLSSTHSQVVIQKEEVKLPEIKNNFKLVETSSIHQLMHTSQHKSFYNTFRKSQQIEAREINNSFNTSPKQTIDFNPNDIQMMRMNQPFNLNNLPHPIKSRHVFKSKVITQRLQPMKKPDIP